MLTTAEWRAQVESWTLIDVIGDHYVGLAGAEEQHDGGRNRPCPCPDEASAARLFTRLTQEATRWLGPYSHKYTSAGSDGRAWKQISICRGGRHVLVLIRPQDADRWIHTIPESGWEDADSVRSVAQTLQMRGKRIEPGLEEVLQDLDRANAACGPLNDATLYVVCSTGDTVYLTGRILMGPRRHAKAFEEMGLEVLHPGTPIDERRTTLTRHGDVDPCPPATLHDVLRTRLRTRSPS